MGALHLSAFFTPRSCAPGGLNSRGLRRCEKSDRTHPHPDRRIRSQPARSGAFSHSASQIMNRSIIAPRNSRQICITGKHGGTFSRPPIGQRIRWVSATEMICALFFIGIIIGSTSGSNNLQISTAGRRTVLHPSKSSHPRHLPEK